MKTQKIELKNVPLSVKVYYSARMYDADEILDALIKAGCSGTKLTEAKSNLWSLSPNRGLTYADMSKGEAIIVIGWATSGAEFDNTLTHEKLHILSYIAESKNLDPYGEEIAYIAGELARLMHPFVTEYLCDCCRATLLRPKKHPKISDAGAII